MDWILYKGTNKFKKLNFINKNGGRTFFCLSPPLKKNDINLEFG